MTKTDAIEMLGGSITAASKALGITYQAVDKWPDELPPRIADRVLGAWCRLNQSSVAHAKPEGAAE
jgi:hypothetical protein